MGAASGRLEKRSGSAFACLDDTGHLALLAARFSGRMREP